MRNSSYSFMPILLKLYRCFCHDLKICMWFGYYPEIIFCHFFCNLNLVIFKCTIMAGDINSLNLLVFSPFAAQISHIIRNFVLRICDNKQVNVRLQLAGAPLQRLAIILKILDLEIIYYICITLIRQRTR